MAMDVHSSWVRVDRSALRHNLSQVRGIVPPSTKIMCVVKADAYGHGLAECARVFASAGADFLGVTTIEEGMEVRSAGVRTAVLIFSPLLPGQIEAAIENDLDQTVCCPETIDAISSAAQSLQKTARVHVKVDTGMGRLGVFPRDCNGFMARLSEHPDIEIAGTYTHFANASAKDPSSAAEQNAVFAETIEILRRGKRGTGLAHAANSAALLSLPDSSYDMVRPGTVLYGQYPSRHTAGRMDLHETWALMTRIAAVRRVPAGTHIGYGSEYTARKPMTLAVIPLGYSDGFTLIPESVARRGANPFTCVAETVLRRSVGPRVTVRGTKCPIVGRVSMQMASIDVSEVDGVEPGDEVLVPARRTTTSSRIPRVYIGQ